MNNSQRIMLKSKLKLFVTLLVPIIISLFVFGGCSYHQRNSHRLVKLTHEEQEKYNERNFQYSHQAYGGLYQKDPTLTAYINNLGQKAARHQNLPTDNFSIVIVNSSIPNVWSFPKGKIAVTRGLLLELKNEAELACILSHEIAHLAQNHGRENIQEVELNAGPVSLNVLQGNKNKDFFVGALGSGSGLIMMQYNTSAEIEADKITLTLLSEMGYSKQSFSDLNERIFEYYKCKNCDWTGGFLAKHPFSLERISINRELLSQNSLLGATEVSQFNQNLEKLRSQSSTYAKLNEGYQALLNSQFAQALEFADQGLDQDPTEFHFYLLKGKAFLKLGYTLDALNALNRAIEINPRYFDNYLQRGLIKEQLDDFGQASNDLEKSLLLLPTAEAYYALGEIDFQRDQHQAAIQNFRKASISNSPGGLKACMKLKELGIALQGLRTIDVRPLFTDEGYIDIEVCNLGLSKLKNVVIDINQKDAVGHSLYRHFVEFNEGISPAQTVCRKTNIGPFINEEHMRKSTQIRPIYCE